MSFKRWLNGFLLLSFLFGLCTQAAISEIPRFRLHLVSEPGSLSPWDQKNSNGLYFLSQLFGSLLKYKDGKLIGDLASECIFKNPRQIDCPLKDKTYSNGQSILAEDFRKSLLLFLGPDRHAPRADLLFSVRGAESYYLGQGSVENVGIQALKGNILRFDLEKNDPEFLYNLTSPLLSPLPNIEKIGPKNSKELISSGAYRLEEWLPTQKIVLVKRDNPQIKLEFLFVSEDSVALNLYEKRDLSFLRRLPTLFIPKYKDRKDFYEVNQIRFDYIAFGPELKNLPKLREALSLSLDFSDIDQILFTKGQYGCPGLPASLFDKMPCLKFNPQRAQDRLIEEKIPKNLKLIYAYSKLGGDDLKRQAEWTQSQWKKHLKLDFQLEQVENKIFVEQLKHKAYPLFRKGVAPERPTCLSAMEFFTNSSSENFLKITDPNFLQRIEKLNKAVEQNKPSKRLCRETVDFLLQNHLLIPTGPIHFSILVRPEWKNWSLNSLNQLDLSELSYSEAVSK